MKSYATCYKCDYRTKSYLTVEEINIQIIKDGADDEEHCPCCGGYLKIEEGESIYSRQVMEDLRRRRGLAREDRSEDNDIMAMPKEQVFKELCNWNGLFGWNNTFLKWVEEIYGIKLN